ncbi:hypothetical protein D0T49_06725 [Paludibacter sp. 221]|nr:hypothetical protein [Paludibacter sp. 221]
MLFVASGNLCAQVTIGADAQPDGNAVLDLRSNYETGKHGGLLLPRVALTSTTSASPLSAHVAGMTIYNTATRGTDNTAVTPGLYYNDGIKWVRQQEAIQQENRTFVYTDANDPNTSGAKFDDVPSLDEEGEVNPAFTNDDNLKSNTTYFYIGQDGSMWIYNDSSSAYVKYVSPAATAWYKGGTELDAGADKTTPICRPGNVGIGGNSSANSALMVQNSTFVNNTCYGVYVATTTPLITDADAKTQRSIVATTYGKVAAGVTSSSSIQGIYSSAMRRGRNDDGNLASISGAQIVYGHYEAQTTGTTDRIYGLYLSPYVRGGIASNLYDIYVRDVVVANGGQVTNRYGIVIEGSRKINYFAGSFGLGTEAPAGKMEVVASNMSALRLHSYKTSNTSISRLYGAMVYYGHQAADLTTATTDIAYGIYVSPMKNSGTVTTAYDIYVGSGDSMNEGTATNHYGIYVGGTHKKNYIAGSLGIGAIPVNTAQLRVAGSVQIGNSGDSASNGAIRYNETTHKFQGRANGVWVNLH